MKDPDQEFPICQQKNFHEESGHVPEIETPNAHLMIYNMYSEKIGGNKNNHIIFSTFSRENHKANVGKIMKIGGVPHERARKHTKEPSSWKIDTRFSFPITHPSPKYRKV